MNTRITAIATGAAALTASAFLLTPEAHGQASAPDDTWASLSGTVVATAPEAFRLDYGSGVMTVEMDDWDWYAEGRNILLNDRVTVYGKMDNGLFEKKTLEASSVFVENLGTYFFASAADEEDLAMWSTPVPIVVGDLVLTGEVTKIDGREMILSPGVQVDTSQLLYNPLDDKGFQQIDVGDRVKVSGPVDHDIFERNEIMADWVINLTPTKEGTQ